MDITLQYVLNFIERWINFIQSAAVIFTLIVLIKYTVETYKLRKETQRQTELSTRPLMIIIREGNSSNFLLKNIGNSAALNISIEPIRLAPGKDYDAVLTFDYDYYSLIEAGSDITIKARVIEPTSQEVFLDSSMTNFDFLLSFSEKNLLKICIKYNNIIGQEYLTEELIINRNIRYKSVQKK